MKLIYIPFIFIVLALMSCKPSPEELKAIIKDGDVQLLSEAIDKNINVNDMIDGEFPLLTAAKAGQSEIMEILINNGADVNIDYEPGFPLALWLAAEEREGDLKLFIENGYDLNKQDEETGVSLIHVVISRYSLNFLEYLLTFDIDLEVKDRKNRTALSFAILVHEIDKAILLIESGANPNYIGYDGASIWVEIAYYAKERELELSNIAYENGAIIKNDGWENGLSAATIEGRTDFILWLLENGADPNVEDSENKIPIDYIYLMTSSPEGKTTQEQKDSFDEVYDAFIRYGSRKPKY